ncbi:MAG: flavodoxin family protein [Firmicutes bacterium]|jgi:multimeric flavodoxin WrbA|nr:flavodoxin family protein [Bacillota bacterium]
MYILALNGSPHRHGNTAHLLEAVLHEAKENGCETKLLYIQEIIKEQKFPYCRACSSPCEGKCYRDSALAQAYDQLRKADALILGSPVYFGTVSSQLKCFWDKSRRLRTEKALINVVGGAISSGGARFGGQETTLKALFDMMLVQGMIIVGDGYIDNDAGHHGVCSQQPSSEDGTALGRALVLARRIVQVTTATASLRQGKFIC